MIQRVIRLLVCTALTAAALLLAAPAQAQFTPQPMTEPASGEQFHIEGSIAVWSPSADIVVASEAFGIPGTNIDFKNDLGLQDKSFPAFQLTARPLRSQKLRLQIIPISYDTTAPLQRSVVFNGQRYPVGADVTSTFDWKAYRFAYEYDFFIKNQGFAGFIVDLKYTDVRVQLTAPIAQGTIDEFTETRAPIPSLGGIGRYYIVPNIAISAEVTGFKLPVSADNKYQGHYLEADIYGTVNFNKYVGAQVGYRTLDLGYVIKSDSGEFTLKGLYFGVVARY